MAKNPGEAITLRSRIKAAEKAAHIANINWTAATNAANAAAVAADRAEEALNKADYNTVAKAFNDAKAVFNDARVAEDKACVAAFATARNLDAAKAAAKAAYAI